MNKSLIWLHEDALRSTHPIFAAAPKSAEVIFVWDNAYLQKMNYSCKRLVFIYESLCELPIKIIEGDTLTTLRNHPASRIYIPSSLNILVQDIIAALAKEKTVITRDDDAFVKLTSKTPQKRFFQYWKKIEKLAFVRDGGNDTLAN